MHFKSDYLKLPQIIKFAWLVTLDNRTYVRLGANDFLRSMKTFDVIVAPCASWPIIAYVNTIRNYAL